MYLGLQSPTRGFHLICSLSLRWTADWWRFLLEQHGIEAWDTSTLELLLPTVHPICVLDSTTYLLWIRSVYLTDIAMSCVCIWSGGYWLLNYLSFWSYPPLGIYFCFCFCFFLTSNWVWKIYYYQIFQKIWIGGRLDALQSRKRSWRKWPLLARSTLEEKHMKMLC